MKSALMALALSFLPVVAVFFNKKEMRFWGVNLWQWLRMFAGRGAAGAR